MAYSSDFGAPHKRRSPRIKLFLLLLVLAVVAAAVWRVGPPPELDFETSVPGIGAETRISASALERSRGLGVVQLVLQQGTNQWLLAEATHEPRPFWAFWGDRVQRVQFDVVVKGLELEGIEEGDATLALSGSRAGTWLRRPAPAVLERRLPVRFRPPSLDLGPQAVVVRQGGSAVVVYRVGDTAVSSGVVASGSVFPGYPVPGGGPNDRFALFAAAYDNSDEAQLRLTATDALGNTQSRAFVSTFRTRTLKTSKINLNDRFLEKVVGEIVSRTEGLAPGQRPLQSYLEINGDLRQKNRAELVQLSRTSAADFLWTEPFIQQPNSQLMDDFAARRTYLYEGRSVDTQDHLGFDLASVRRAPVVASNRGRVVLARYFGIYGNAVVVDHGYGLHSLYAHLSSIDVAVGDLVEQRQTVGRSGETGLAGGDHLHFALLVGGRPVDPLEWFDERWIKSRVFDHAEELGVGNSE